MNAQEKQDMQFQIECLTHDLVVMLMEERGVTMEQALDLLYNSHTYEKIERENTGLYYQGAVYVMEFLREELDEATNNPILKTEEDLQRKIVQAEQEYQQGKTYAMLPGETLKDFRNRIGR